MSKDRYVIRTMTQDEIDIAVDWAASEGWNPGLNDAASFYAADPEGFLIGELDHEPIAVISAVKYGQTFGFIGFYIVKPAYRGRGYGIQIWKAAIERLSGRNIGLDGVVDQQANYRKSGFKLAYRNIRYEGVSGGSLPGDPSIIDVENVSFEAIEAYDRLFFPDRRTAFLRSWITQPETVSLGVMQVGGLSGYGTIRACRSGFKIGPLFADAPGLARSLFSALIARVPPDRPIFLDTPEVNPEAVALAESHRMTVVFETARMYTGDFPDIPLKRLFGVTTFELG